MTLQWMRSRLASILNSMLVLASVTNTVCIIVLSNALYLVKPTKSNSKRKKPNVILQQVALQSLDLKQYGLRQETYFWQAHFSLRDFPSSAPLCNEGSSGVFLSFKEQVKALNGERLCVCPYDWDSVEINQLSFSLAWTTSWASALKHPFCQGFWVLWRALQSHVRNYFLDINIFTLFQLSETQLRCWVRKEKTN